MCRAECSLVGQFHRILRLTANPMEDPAVLWHPSQDSLSHGEVLWLLRMQRHTLQYHLWVIPIKVWEAYRTKNWLPRRNHRNQTLSSKMVRTSTTNGPRAESRKWPSDGHHRGKENKADLKQPGEELLRLSCWEWVSHGARRNMEEHYRCLMPQRGWRAKKKQKKTCVLKHDVQKTSPFQCHKI